jgi:hypothetical protein
MMVASSFLAALRAVEWATFFSEVAMRAAVMAVRQRISGFWLREQRAGEDAPSQSLVVAGFSRLENLQDLPDHRFLLDGRMRLLQRQICQPELSLSDGELVACRGPYSQRLLVHLTSAGKIGLLKQQTSQSPHGISRTNLIAVFLPDREGLFETLLGADQVPLQLVHECDVVTAGSQPCRASS